MKLRYFALIAALATTALFFAACGGGDDADSSGDSTRTGDSTATSNGTKAPEKTTEATKAGTGGATAAVTTGGGTGQVTGSGADELRKLAKDTTNKTYQVTYDMSTAEGSGILTLAQKPPRLLSRAEILTVTSTVINDGKTTLSCSKLGSADGTCRKTASTGNANAGAFSLATLLGDLESDFSATVDKDETIAGRAAKCFIVKEEGAFDGRACFDKQDGIILSLESTDAKGGKLNMKASKYSNSVNDSTFDAPYICTRI